MVNPSMQFDPARFRELKRLYKKAVSEGAESFHPSFCPGPLLTSYAKYLIEYLEPILGERKP